MKRPLFIWIICTFLLTLCFLISGCVTKGGKKISSGSVGTIIRPQTGEQMNRSARFNPLVSQPAPTSAVPSEPTRSKPTVESQKILKESVVAKTPPVVVKTPPVKLKNLEPTVSLPPTKVEVNPALPEEEKVNVLPPAPPSSPVDSSSKNGEESVENGANLGIINGEKEIKMETSWTDLLIYYGLLLVLVLIIWVVSRERYITKLKNWWSGDKVAPKKARKKAPKKAAKKTQKKKVANKGERKSTLAAKKKPKKKPKKKS